MFVPFLGDIRSFSGGVVAFSIVLITMSLWGSYLEFTLKNQTVWLRRIAWIDATWWYFCSGTFFIIWYDMIWYFIGCTVVSYDIMSKIYVHMCIYIYIHINHIIWKAMFWPCVSWNVVTCRDVVRHDWKLDMNSTYKTTNPCPAYHFSQKPKQNNRRDARAWSVYIFGKSR